MEADLRFVATDEERAAVYRLRYDLYVEDQKLFGEEADHQRRWLTDDLDAHSRLVLAEVDGQAVGSIRITWGADTGFSDSTRKSFDITRFRGIVEERDVMLVTRFVVRHEHRGGPLGFQLFWKAFEFAAQNNADLILGTCEPHLVSHYRKLGSRPFGKLYNHPINGLLIPIVIVTGDFEHLRRVDSPMLGVARQRTRPVPHLDQILAAIAETPAVVSEELKDKEEYFSEVTYWLDDPDEGLRGILGDLTREEAIVLLAKSHILSCDAGDALILKGHVSRTLYILLSGSLEVHDDGKFVAGVDQRGAVVGEVALFSGGPRMSDVIAGPRGAHVLALSDRILHEIISSYGPLAAKFLYFVARGLSHKLLERIRGPGAGSSPGPPSV